MPLLFFLLGHWLVVDRCVGDGATGSSITASRLTTAESFSGVRRSSITLDWFVLGRDHAIIDISMTATEREHKTEELLRLRQSSVTRGVGTVHPIFITRAKGARVWDTDGKEYLDFIGGIGVLNAGHNHPRVVEAVRRQLECVTHTCFQVVMYEPYIRLAARLNELVGGSEPNKTLLLSTGVEATENAIKIARAATNRQAVIAFQGGFHGRTLMGMSLTATSSSYRQNFGPFAPEIYHAPYPYEYRGITTERALQALSELFETLVSADRVAAIIIEPQLGEGGFVPAPVEFMQALRALTVKHGIVLIADEIQSGFGRTGKMFAFQHSGIEPDLVAMAKSLGGGLPLSAVTGKASIMDAPNPGSLGGTYAGNPLACAAALAVLDVFQDEHLVEAGEKLGRQIQAGFRKLRERHPQIGDVRGLGAMQAMEFDDPNLVQRIVDGARAKGLLLLKCGPHKNVIRALVPLVATAVDIDCALDTIECVIAEETK